jgi:hypothetical protein
MKNTLSILTMILGLANVTAGAAESATTSPSTWWVAGPFPIYDQTMFAANEPMEDAKEWKGVPALTGRELIPTQIGATESGAVDLARAYGGTAYVTAYAGATSSASATKRAPATLTASGPARWFFNGKLIGESKEKGVLKVTLPLKKGSNALLAKSWNPTNSAEWSVSCAIAAASPLIWEAPAKALSSVQPGTGRRNVALASEGSQVAVSSVPARSLAFIKTAPSMLNDGMKPGSPNGAGTSWNSLDVDGMPQWVWIRFPGLGTLTAWS